MWDSNCLANMTNTAWDRPSRYFQSLTNTDKADKRKLTLSTGELLSDPFTIKNWKCDESLLPDISWPEIYNYLIEYPSVFSKESLKSYKSLKGYNFFFISGHVQEVYYQDSSPTNQEFCFIKSEVLPIQLQGLKQKLYEVWVCIHKQKGWTLTANCTCMAG